TAAADKHGVSEDHFLFTNGATEAFYLIAQAFVGQKAAIVAPTFSEYQDACRIHGLPYDLVKKAALDPTGYGLVWLCNPNNPDGTLIPSNELIDLIEDHPATTFVVDEAYIEFTDQLASLAAEVKRLSNLIVVRSLTKTFAIPGLRLGYVMAAQDLIGRLLSKKMPWSVNTLAIHAGLEIFEHYETWQFEVAELLEETRAFAAQVFTTEGLEVIPSHTSYFLVKLHRGTAAGLKAYLAEQHGILVRDATNFQGLDGEHIRLATQGPEANQALLNALKQWN
ncbi:MAG TPA: hypothetical protein DCP28_18415, partial [Cytophagales bacterium]|nr:hypothetical protein [Cytophagales bacterium]